MPRLTLLLRLILLLLVALTTTCARTTRWTDRVEEFRLPNGMLFLLVPHGEAPIFTATIRFRAGGIDEEPGKTGLAHFLEHMAFKGTERIGTNDFEKERPILEKIETVGAELSSEYARSGGGDPAKIKELRGRLRQLHEEQSQYLVREEVHKKMIEAGGEDYNASTSKDMTTYYVSLPSDQIRFWAEWESERIFHPIFREFYEEKDVVLEERRMRIENDPDGRLFELLLKTAFLKSPYRWPTIGASEDLLRLTPADLRVFWEKHYQPNNAVGVVVGRFDLSSLKTLLNKTFGAVPSRRGDETPQYVGEDPPPPGERRRVLKERSRPKLTVAYPKPTLPEWDDYVFDVLDEILGEGRSSRLYRALILDKKVAAQVSTHSGVPGSRLPNLFTIGVAPLGDHSNGEVLRHLDDEIEAIRQSGVSEEEVERAVNRLQADLVWRLRTNEGLAQELSYFQVVAGSWRYLADYGEKIRQVSREDLRRVARTYLNPQRRTIVMIEP